jgi:hypothetical protein
VHAVVGSTCVRDATQMQSSAPRRALQLNLGEMTMRKQRVRAAVRRFARHRLEHTEHFTTATTTGERTFRAFA